MGNKIDLIEKNPSARKVTQGDIESMKKLHNISYYTEISALHYKNVEDLFKIIKSVIGGGGILRILTWLR